MKILQLLQKPQFRGAELFASQLAQELTTRGHQVALIFLYPGLEVIPFTGLKIYLNANPGSRMWDMQAWKKLAAVINDFKPDIVQANAGDTLKYACFSRLLFGWKNKLVFRNANLISGFVNTPVKQVFNQILMTQVDAVASVSLSCMNDFQAVFAWKKPIIHLPIGTEILDENLPLAQKVAELIHGKPYLVHVGSFVPEKNHEGLFRIFRKIRDQFPDVCLILVGDGPLRGELEKRLPDHVFSLGPRRDAASILKQSKGLLLPSLIEGLPGVILEAMANKVPVVAYGVGGIAEVLKQEETGFLVAKGEEEQFANVVVQSILQPSPQLGRLTQQALDKVKNEYALDLVCLKFEAFYLTLLKQVHANSYS